MQGKLESLLSLGLVITLVSYMALKPNSRNIALHNFLAAIVIVAFITNSFVVLSCDAAKEERIKSNYGELQGMAGVASWLRKNTRPKERLLTFNPRQTACLLDYPYRHFADLSWWDIEQPLPQIKREYLVKNRIDWIIISRPEAYGPLRQGLYQKMRRSDYLIQVYLETTADGEVIAAIFKLREEGKI